MIPLRITFAFWIFAGLIGFLLGQGNIIQSLIWVAIIFGSVLFHEFGHALMAKMFGLKPRIELVAMGGLTYHNGDKLPFWKQFLITLNGPLFGFLLVIGAEAILRYAPVGEGVVQLVLMQIAWINLVWTIVNLLPIMPLDGGQLVRILCEKIFHAKGLKYTFLMGAIFALLCSLFFFLVQNLLGGALFFLFAFENFDGFRKSKFLSDTDRNLDLKKLFTIAEQQMRIGDQAKALADFESVRKQAKGGLLYVAATQYVAILKYEKGEIDEAFQLLLPIKDRLDPEGLFLLHRAAFEKKNYHLVLELAGAVYQIMPEAEVALRSAYAAGYLGEAEPAIGWLQTSLSSGVENMQEIIKEETFDPVREDTRFIDFTLGLKESPS